MKKTAKFGEDVEQPELSDCGAGVGGWKMVQPLKIIWQFYKVNIHFGTATPLLGIYLREIQTCLERLVQKCS